MIILLCERSLLWSVCRNDHSTQFQHSFSKAFHKIVEQTEVSTGRKQRVRVISNEGRQYINCPTHFVTEILQNGLINAQNALQSRSSARSPILCSTMLTCVTYHLIGYQRSDSRLLKGMWTKNLELDRNAARDRKQRWTRKREKVKAQNS